MSIYGHYKFSYILGYIYCRITCKSTGESINSITLIKDPKSVLQKRTFFLLYNNSRFYYNSYYSSPATACDELSQ
jgi:hypothetical protein